MYYYILLGIVLVAARVCGRSLAGIVGSNPAGHGYLSLVSVVYCRVEVAAKGRSVIQRNPTECVCQSLSVIKCNGNVQHVQ